MKRLVLGAMAMVLSLGWAGPGEAGGRGKGGRGHGGGHHGSYYGGHHYGHHYYQRGHRYFDDRDYALLLLYGVPPLLSALTGWNHPARAATRPT